MSVPPIPLDVVRLILEYLPQDFRAGSLRLYAWLHSRAASLMFVCKSWTSVVLDVIWREVCLWPGAWTGMVPLLSRQDLLDRVRVLRIKYADDATIYDDRVHDDMYSSGREWDAVPILLNRATRITVLDLPAHVPYSPFLTTAAYASIATTVTALELDILPHDDPGRFDLELFWSCLPRFPHLTRLRIANETSEPWADATGAVPKLRIRHLTLEHGDAHEPDPQAVRKLLQQLEPTHLHSLELLHPVVRIMESSDPLSPLGGLTSLKRLSMRTIDDEDLVELLPRLCDLLPRLAHLADLELSYTEVPDIWPRARPANVATVRSPTPLRHLLDALPPSIRRCKVEDLFFNDWKPTKWLFNTRGNLSDDTVATVSLQVPARRNEGGTEIKQFRLVRSSTDSSDW